jgi:hypothetical protein
MISDPDENGNAYSSRLYFNIRCLVWKRGTGDRESGSVVEDQERAIMDYGGA